MTQREEGELLEPTRSLVSALNDSIAGHARHAATLVSWVADPNDDVDPQQEFGQFLHRAMRDGARLFEITWSMFDVLAWRQSKVPDTSPLPVELPPSSNPCSARVGPVAPTGDIFPQGLRRRGDAQVTIAATQVRVVRDRADPTQLVLQIEAGGCPRGLYEGTVMIGSAGAAAPLSYNIYVDF